MRSRAASGCGRTDRLGPKRRRYFSRMANPSPYRSLSADRRVALVAHAIKASKEGRATFVQRLAARGGFRPTTLQQWPAEKLAAEIVRTKAESSSDELDLLHLLY